MSSRNHLSMMCQQEDTCGKVWHVGGMLGRNLYMWNVRRIIEKHLEDMCHVIGMLGKEPLHLECQN